MKVIIVENYEEASQEAAKIFINQVKEKPNSILGLATGSTPVRMYELLREDHEKNHTSYKDVKSYNLDEYFGLVQVIHKVIIILCIKTYSMELILKMKMFMFHVDKEIFKKTVMNIIKC